LYVLLYDLYVLLYALDSLYDLLYVLLYDLYVLDSQYDQFALLYALESQFALCDLLYVLGNQSALLYALENQFALCHLLYDLLYVLYYDLDNQATLVFAPNHSDITVTEAATETATAIITALAIDPDQDLRDVLFSAEDILVVLTDKPPTFL